MNVEIPEYRGCTMLSTGSGWVIRGLLYMRK
jgi:hypothetical protein